VCQVQSWLGLKPTTETRIAVSQVRRSRSLDANCGIQVTIECYPGCDAHGQLPFEYKGYQDRGHVSPRSLQYNP
jgi:hypothetical protein